MSKRTHSMISVFLYDGISLITGLPVNVKTLNSGISDIVFTINMSSIRLYDKSKMESLLHLVNAFKFSIDCNKLCDRHNEFNSGRTDESQLSMDFIWLCERFNVSKREQCSKLSIFWKLKTQTHIHRSNKEHSNLEFG